MTTGDRHPDATFHDALGWRLPDERVAGLVDKYVLLPYRDRRQWAADLHEDLAAVVRAAENEALERAALIAEKPEHWRGPVPKRIRAMKHI